MNLSLNSWTLGRRDFPSPSPRPSPQGRGKIVSSPSARQKRSGFPRNRMRDSLSLGERVGVRGKEIFSSTVGSICFGSGALGAQEIRGVLSLKKKTMMFKFPGEVLIRTALCLILLGASTTRVLSKDKPSKAKSKNAVKATAESAKLFGGSDVQ